MIIWTDYMRYRARLRGYSLDEVEKIVRFSAERYVDEATARHLVVGRHGGSLVLIPFETRRRGCRTRHDPPHDKAADRLPAEIRKVQTCLRLR
jgi:hypothetical protein